MHRQKLQTYNPPVFILIFYINFQVTESIVIFFLQKFCGSHSNPEMDKLIVDQLGCIAIARLVLAIALET